MRSFVAGWLSAVMLGLAAPAHATHVARPVPSQAPPRGPVVVPRGFPIQRAPVVVYRPRHRHHPHLPPRVFLPLVLWPAVRVSLPPVGWVVWNDEQPLARANGWTELLFDVHEHGRLLLLDLGGEAELDFAEVTFEDGAVQVVDFGRSLRQPASYQLLPLAPQREIEHVRVVARAAQPRLRLGVRLIR